MATKLTKYDPAEYLGDPADQGELIAEAFESGDPAFIKAALNTNEEPLVTMAPIPKTINSDLQSG